jgi:Nucleotidyl transferase AbiEii toxin, Type IV TA system
MHPSHEHLARIGLRALAGHGFALAGGYAVQAHGIVTRLSEDVDLFTTMESEATFPEAVQLAVAAYHDAGLEVEIVVNSPAFARLQVTDPGVGPPTKIELGIDWRRDPPATLPIGPVLSRDDAVANKVNALYSRAQARDYIDVDAALTSGRYNHDTLIRLATEHDPGFEPAMFAVALRAIRRLPVAEFTAYGLTTSHVALLVERMIVWADALAAEIPKRDPT